MPPVQTPVAHVPPLTDEAASDPPSDSGSMVVDEQPAPLPSSRARARPPPHVPAVPLPTASAATANVEAAPQTTAPNVSTSLSLGAGGVTREPPQAEAADVPEHKRLRVQHVSEARIGDDTYYHADEDISISFQEKELEWLESHDLDLSNEVANEPLETSVTDIPPCLIHPFGETEPALSSNELESVDAVAAQYEVDRLKGLGVLRDVSGPLEGYRLLTTKFVYTWRAKAINGVDVFLRRGRLVAREYAHLDPDREGLFSPATKLIPSCFMTQKGQGWSMLAFDVSDAYLTVDQGSPTVTSVRVDGQHLWFALDRCLPEQRDGSARWYQEFTRFLKDQADAELMPQLPALFRLPDKKGSGLIHVDDVLAAGLTLILERLASTVASKYKISVQWVKEPGDKLVFLKKVHTLISPLELVIEMPRKHIDRLEELCGLRKAKPRERKTAFPSGRLPTEVDNDPLLADDAASAFRTAVGILLYLQPDAAAAQHAIRYLASYMSKPSEGAWKLLRHVVGFLRQHAGYCLCFEVPEVGQGCKVFTPSQHCIELCTDADWSGNRLTRKSVSGSVIMVNKHVVFSASRTQKIIALSSAESEFHSAVSGSIDGLLIKAAVDYVYPGEASAVNVLVDNSAARAIAARQGVGRVRHIHAKMLWLQQRVSFGDLIMRPVETAINLADLQTKSLSPARTKFLLGLMNFKDASCLSKEDNALLSVCLSFYEKLV